MKTTTRQLRPSAALLCSLAALGLAGCESSSDPVFVGGPPAVPTGVTTITGDQRVTVLWNPVRGNNVEGYGVYRSDTTIDGAYHRQTTVLGEESDSWVDTGVTNGETYFYAVDAFNFQGQESALSYEDAFDTPRPEGSNLQLWAKEDNPGLSGLDLETPGGALAVVQLYNHLQTDFFVQRVDGVLYVKGRAVDGVWNDLQDLGYTESMDEISWAPADGWSISPTGIELIAGHTYVVWTHDDHYAKFRVKTILLDGQSGLATAVSIDWAYQIDSQNPELSPLFMARGEAPAREES